MIDRTTALNLLYEYTKTEGLRKHAHAVEIALRAYAERFGEDVELWGITGLLHDFDYEMYPTIEDHPYRGSEILHQHGYPEEIITAVLSHASYTGIPRTSRLAKTLFACDELTGLLTACALVRPNKKIEELEVSSVKKKMKDKGFARTVNRQEIVEGAADLGIPLDEHIGFVLAAMKQHCEVLGL